jgi:hypothetical protein
MVTRNPEERGFASNLVAYPPDPDRHNYVFPPVDNDLMPVAQPISQSTTPLQSPSVDTGTSSPDPVELSRECLGLEIV